MNVRGVLEKAKKVWRHKSSEDLDQVQSRLDKSVEELAELIRTKDTANGLDRGQS